MKLSFFYLCKANGPIQGEVSYLTPSVSIRNRDQINYFLCVYSIGDFPFSLIYILKITKIMSLIRIHFIFSVDGGHIYIFLKICFKVHVLENILQTGWVQKVPLYVNLIKPLLFKLNYHLIS